jgi:hypothetical protein
MSYVMATSLSPVPVRDVIDAGARTAEGATRSKSIGMKW